MRIAPQRSEHRGRLDPAVAESPQPPERQIPVVGAALNLLEKFADALRRFDQVVGRQINLHSSHAHARIVRVQSCEHQVEQMIRIFQMAAPGRKVPVNQAKRKLRLLDGELEQSFRLLLRRKARNLFDVAILHARLRRRNERRRCVPGVRCRDRMDL